MNGLASYPSLHGRVAVEIDHGFVQPLHAAGIDIEIEIRIGDDSVIFLRMSGRAKGQITVRMRRSGLAYGNPQTQAGLVLLAEKPPEVILG